jgi:chemotaxis protein MotA
VGTANLIFLPCASKLRLRIREKQVIQEMTLEAVLSILQGVNQRTLEQQLGSFLPGQPRRHQLEKAPA